MDEETLNKKLRELISEVASLPKEKQKQLAPLVEETKSRQKEIKTNSDKIAKSLSDLRICLKYTMFDLEATRRERDKFKAMLQDENEDDGDDEDNNYNPDYPPT